MMSSFVTHLESAIDGTHLPHDRPQTLHAGRPLLVRYDLEAVSRAVDRETMAARPSGFWRWRELLPVEEESNRVSLGETDTPLVPCPRLGAALGVPGLLIKDESRLPTGSFKARGLALAVARAKELGLTRLAIPTAGNAGGAMAAYAARAGLEAWVFMPEDTPIVNRVEAAVFGARVFLVDGLIQHCGEMVAAGGKALGWFDISTLKEPYRIEGKKTMGLELAQQLDWTLPDAILYPTGGGTGLIGMWKAFAELEALGWLDETKRPRMYACQSDGCAPIVSAFEAGTRHAEPFPDPETVASGIRVPKAVGDFLILDAVRESGGRAIAAPEGDLLDWMNRSCALEGLSICPETAACLASLDSLVKAGEIGPDERVVVFNTAGVQKYVEAMERELPRLSRHAEIDWQSLAGPRR